VRTVAEVRHAFNKHGGNLGTDGSVAFMFKHCGTLLFAPGVDEDKLMEAALEAGADDVVSNDDGSVEVVTGPYDFVQVKETLATLGFKSDAGEVTMKAQNEVVFTGDDAARMQKLLDAFDAVDDVQDVYTSAVIQD
jgi:transcriptional/translational regulatory protein YebC/TACO1